MAYIWPQLNPKHQEEGALGIRSPETQILVLPAFLPLNRGPHYLVQKSNPHALYYLFPFLYSASNNKEEITFQVCQKTQKSDNWLPLLRSGVSKGSKMHSANIYSRKDNVATGRKGIWAQALTGQTCLALARVRILLSLTSYTWKLIRKTIPLASELFPEISSLMQTLKIFSGTPCSLEAQVSPSCTLSLFGGAHPHAQQEVVAHTCGLVSDEGQERTDGMLSPPYWSRLSAASAYLAVLSPDYAPESPVYNSGDNSLLKWTMEKSLLEPC